MIGIGIVLVTLYIVDNCRVYETLPTQNLNMMKELLEKSGFTKIDGLDKWFINFQGRTYYLFMDGGKWWVLINKSETDIKVNQTGFTTFEHIRDFFNAVTLGGVVLYPYL